MTKSDAGAPRPVEAVASNAAKGAVSPRFARAGRWAMEIAIFVGVYLGITSFQERNLLRAHSPAPAFELSTLDGRTVSLDSLHGKHVALHFWATWCGVCRQEEGALGAVQKGLGKDEALYAIVADSEDREKVRRYIQERHIEYPVLLGNSDVLAAFHVGSFPTTYYVDREGRVGSHTVGMSTRLSIRARLSLLD
jgi:thiol-disulfide isomerase/thioredoxin